MELIETYEEQRLDLGDNTHLYLEQKNISVPESGLTSEDFGRNVYRMTDSGEMLWRIKKKFEDDVSPFTLLFVDENPRLMYCSSGFRYLVNLKTGVAKTYDYPLLGQWKKRSLPSEYPAIRYFKRQKDIRVYLDDGTYLFLALRSMDHSTAGLSAEDYACNVFRMTESGEVIWRIKTDRDSFGSPFIGIYLDEDPRKMANWDGLQYLVDLETGAAEAYAYSQ